MTRGEGVPLEILCVVAALFTFAEELAAKLAGVFNPV